MIQNVPKTGWFKATEPQRDYELLKEISTRGGFGNKKKVDIFDLIGLEGDFRKGQYELRDYLLGFVDGGSRYQMAENAIHDMNSYLRALRHFENREGSLERLVAVRLHQTNYRIDRLQFVTRRVPQALVC